MADNNSNSNNSDATAPAPDTVVVAAPGDGAAGTPPAADDVAGDAGGAEVTGTDGASAPAPGTGASSQEEKVQVQQPDESWKVKKYDTIYAKLKQAQEELARVKARPAEGNGQAQTNLTEEEVERRANELANQRRMNEQANAIVGAGAEKYGEAQFKDRIVQLRQNFNQYDANEVAAYNAIMQAAVETGEAPKLIFELGANPGKVQELIEAYQSSPLKVAVELTKMAGKTGEQEPSQAPRPLIVKAEGRGGSRETISASDPNRADKLDMRDWMARRNKEVEEKNKSASGGVRLR